MKQSYILSFLAAGLLLTGCSKENPFPQQEGEGQFLKSALSVDLKIDETFQKKAPTRAGEVSVDDFTVTFHKDGLAQPYVKYKYGEMPDVVVLPAGTYTCTATYGENRAAAWESPYYAGSSESFEVVPYEITSYVEPIKCYLENIMVSIDFDSVLREHMSEDSYVEVKVGQSEGLQFGLDEANAAKPGYFKHTAEETLVATFYGKVNGKQTVESKSYKNIEKGNHYKITFKLHSNEGGGGTGDIDGGLTVDASVTVTDVERNVDVEDDVLDDNERPEEGGDEPTPPGPDPDEPKHEAPTITSVAPIDLDIVNTVDGSAPVGLKVVSTAEGGFTEFVVEIVSPDLTPEALAEVGLAANLNLAETPDSFATALTNFGFPVNVKGQKEANIEISTMLLGMLAGVGAGHEHQFILTVTDANGTTVKALKLYIPE